MKRERGARIPAAASIAPRLLGTFFAFATAMCALTAWSLFAPRGPSAAIWALKPEQYRQLLSFGPAAGAGFALLAIAMALACIGCFGAKRWGLWLATALIGINAAADALRALAGERFEGLTGFAIASLVLWALFRPAVREAFQR